MNAFKVDEPPPEQVFKVDPGAGERQIAKVQALRASRDQKAVDASLVKLREVCASGANVMPATVEAVKTFATIGEIFSCGAKSTASTFRSPKGSKSIMETARKFERPLRVVITKVGLDGHDRGVKVIAQAFRDAGMEVIYAGLRRTPEQIADIVLQEDADVLGLSILSGAVVPLTTKVLAALKAREVDDVLMVVGGIVTKEAKAELNSIGVKGIFGPGASLTEIIDFVHKNVPQLRAVWILCRYG